MATLVTAGLAALLLAYVAMRPDPQAPPPPPPPPPVVAPPADDPLARKLEGALARFRTDDARGGHDLLNPLAESVRLRADLHEQVLAARRQLVEGAIARVLAHRKLQPDDLLPHLHVYGGQMG